MKKDTTFKLLAAIIIIALVLFLYYQYSNTTVDKNFLNRLREENKSGFDSLQSAIIYENDLNYRIEEKIADSDFKTARSLMDSLPPFGKSHSFHIYQGMIYEKEKRYNDAIQEFTSAISEVPFSKARSLRADLYLKMNKLDSSLNDYIQIYDYNSHFGKEVANVFLLMNKPDSASKYYQEYLKHYPDDKTAQQKLKRLTK